MVNNENEELVPIDDEDIEDIKPSEQPKTDPALKPVEKSKLVSILSHIKNQKIGFKFDDVYFEISDVNLNNCTFTAKPANPIIKNHTINKPAPKATISQKDKKKKRKK